MAADNADSVAKDTDMRYYYCPRCYWNVLVVVIALRMSLILCLLASSPVFL